MTSLWDQPWFVAAIVVAVATPVVLIVLTELIGIAARRDHPSVRPLRLARNLLVPSTALLVLLVFADGFRGDGLVLVRIAATIVGFVAVLLMLSAFNAALFGTPAPDTWRARLPSIFVDIARLILALVGLGVLFAIVWNADIGGLLATLGVTSIVLGLALQGAIGSVVSGLLLLFEQPFRLGDVIESASGSGRVVEVNWRSVHIQSADGIVIVPNATLAAAVFTNRSRSDDGFAADLVLAFPPSQAPRPVMTLLRQVGDDLPLRRGDRSTEVTYEGDGAFRMLVPVTSASAVDPSIATLREWVWYAARRAGMPLAGTGTGTSTGTTDHGPVADEARAVAAALRLSSEQAARLLGEGAVEVFAPGELLQRDGATAESVQVILNGAVRYDAIDRGVILEVAVLGPGEFLGQTALTAETSRGRYTAASETTVARLPVAAVAALLAEEPGLARTLGTAVDLRRTALDTALVDRSTAG